MVGYKLRIYARTVIVRMEAEGVTAEEIVSNYTKLTDAEKQEVLTEVKRMQ